MQNCIFTILKPLQRQKMIENKNPKRTSIAQLAEFGLIDHLTKNFSIVHLSNLKGICFDATVLYFEEKKESFWNTGLF